MSTNGSVDLAITRRCVQEDLDDDPRRSLSELAASHTVVDKFRQLRSQSPIGQERILSIAGVEVYSLHVSRYRGATWHDRGYEAVWLVAYRIHREGESEDAYPYFHSLHRRRRLLPEDADYTRLFADRTESTLRDSLMQVMSLVDIAKTDPGIEHTVILPDGTRVALVVEADAPCDDAPDWCDSAIVYIAISPRAGLLKDTIPSLLAAALPDADWQEWEYATTLPTRPVRSEEVAFCHG